ncbi:hypothetical protein M9458_016903, partial [Cirrhinus mrigala]
TSSFFSPAPGQLSRKPEPSTSTGDAWKFLQSLSVDTQPKAAAANTFTSQSAAQDFSTVNLSDLHDFTLNNFITSDQMSAPVAAEPVQNVAAVAVVSQDVHNVVDGDDELPEFPSFSEVQGSDVDNINIEDFQALLVQSGLPGEVGLGMGKPACHGSTASDAQEPAADHAGNGSTIASLIQNESMMESAAPPAATSAVLDDLEVLNSIDDDRFMSASYPDTRPRTRHGAATDWKRREPEGRGEGMIRLKILVHQLNQISDEQTVSENTHSALLTGSANHCTASSTNDC